MRSIIVVSFASVSCFVSLAAFSFHHPCIRRRSGLLISDATVSTLSENHQVYLGNLQHNLDANTIPVQQIGSDIQKSVSEDTKGPAESRSLTDADDVKSWKYPEDLVPSDVKQHKGDATPATLKDIFTVVALMSTVVDSDRSWHLLMDMMDAEREPPNERQQKDNFRMNLQDVMSVYMDHVGTPALRAYKNDSSITCHGYLDGAFHAAKIKYINTLPPDDPRKVLLAMYRCSTDLTERYKEVDAATKSFGNVSIQKIYEIAAWLRFQKREKYYERGIAQPSEEEFGRFLASTYDHPHTADEEPELVEFFKEVQDALERRKISLCDKYGY